MTVHYGGIFLPLLVTIVHSFIITFKVELQIIASASWFNGRCEEAVSRTSLPSKSNL